MMDYNDGNWMQRRSMNSPTGGWEYFNQVTGEHVPISDEDMIAQMVETIESLPDGFVFTNLDGLSLKAFEIVCERRRANASQAETTKES
jgi:hypothetical protein